MGVEEKLDYIESCNVNYLHLMPLLDTPRGQSDGGYAVSDFRKVREDLGTMKDLEMLASRCHKRGISVCLDFVVNHTSKEHEWAKRAMAGEKEYQDRYFFFDRYDIPAQYEKTVPQVFPTTAPGNFTWFPESQSFVKTSLYPYQWDLNYRNPVVLNEMMFHFLYLANRGIHIIRIDAVPYIWKQLGTDCRNLPQVHTIVRLMRMIGEIVCPGVLLLGEVVMEPEKVAPYFGTVEKAGFEMDQEGMGHAIGRILTLHSFMLFLSGIPVIYSGDEIRQVNDYTYKDDPEKAADSRYIHRGAFQWDLTQNNDRIAWIHETDGMYEDMVTGERMKASGVRMEGHGFRWLRQVHAGI